MTLAFKWTRPHLLLAGTASGAQTSLCGDAQQQIGDHGRKDLQADCVFAGTKKLCECRGAA